MPLSEVRVGSALSPPMALTASKTFWPSERTPITTSSEIAVALRSSRTRTTVPSRISRVIGSSASERVFHASQSLHLAAHPAHRVLAQGSITERMDRMPEAQKD
jgi:hypothetical protein